MSIALAGKFQPILDEIYARESVTAGLDAPTKAVDFLGANEVKVFKTSVIGLGTYSRTTGYPAGDVTGAWETMTLSKERGRAFSIDRMDNEETLGQAFGTLAAEFLRTKVAPELDAYRFATYAGWSGIQTTTAAALSTSSAVLAAIDVAMGKLDEKEVPYEGRVLFAADGIYNLLKGAVTRSLSNEQAVDRRVFTLDGVSVVRVPQTRFYTAIDLNAGATSNAGGYAKGGAATNINFMLLHPSAVLQVVKHAALKVFNPEQNQTGDSWLVQYRLYHDAFVFDNKVNGIYLHKSNA